MGEKKLGESKQTKARRGNNHNRTPERSVKEKLGFEVFIFCQLFKIFKMRF